MVAEGLWLGSLQKSFVEADCSEYCVLVSTLEQYPENDKIYRDTDIVYQ